jgi:hypothetical protein
MEPFVIIVKDKVPRPGLIRTGMLSRVFISKQEPDLVVAG